MHNRFVTWLKKNKTALIITGTVIVITGAVAVVLIGNERIALSIKELAEGLKPRSTNQLNSSASSVVNETISVIEEEKSSELIEAQADGIVKFITRPEHIRKLHEGWKASDRKIAEAIEKGIILNDGETLVNGCIAKYKAA